MKKLVRHHGVVESKSVDSLSVKLNDELSCDGCALSGRCMTSNKKEKVVNISLSHPGKYEVGQEVIVVAQGNLFLRSVFFAYVIPVVVLFAGLLFPHVSETVAAGLAILFLAMYYTILYICKSLLNRKFTFLIEEKEN